MNAREGDIVMAGLMLGALLFYVLVASCCWHMPRGPDGCVSPTPTVDCAGGVCPFRDPSDAGSDP